tara:strand:- start:1548 stop:1667 length:120 start_codon:yes stop_codon:yes gene_type:complete
MIINFNLVAELIRLPIFNAYASPYFSIIRVTMAENKTIF